MSDKGNIDGTSNQSDPTDDNQFEINDEICQKLVEQFVSYTSTDEALAQYYLQDRNWNLQTSLNDYFDDLRLEARKRKVNEQSSDSEDEISIINESTSRALTHSPNKSIKFDTKCDATPKPLKQLFFVTWNIDGLNEKNIRIRTEAVCNIIKSEKVAIIFLQEVVALTEQILRENLPEYLFCASDQKSIDYYCATLLRKDCVELVSKQIIDFENTSMGRNMLKINVRVNEANICLINTHLESTKDFAAIRMAQLNKALKFVKSLPNEETVIFAGDLNLRDSELASIGGLPDGISDIWVTTGSRKECEFTWDQTRNDNLPALSGSKWKPRCRFDRVLLRSSSPHKLTATHFGLIGLQRLKPHVCFPSDHWGIICYFDLN